MTEFLNLRLQSASQEWSQQQSQCYEHGKSKHSGAIVSRSLNESNSKSGRVKGEGIATQEPHEDSPLIISNQNPFAFLWGHNIEYCHCEESRRGIKNALGKSDRPAVTIAFSSSIGISLKSKAIRRIRAFITYNTQSIDCLLLLNRKIRPSWNISSLFSYKVTNNWTNRDWKFDS